MKNSFKFYIPCLFFLFGGVLFAQERQVVFFYGLGKNQNDISAYMNKFSTERRIRPLPTTGTAFTYQTRQTAGMPQVIQDATTEATQFLGVNVSNIRNVAIGHDMGGLIAQSIASHSNMFRGIILTGTPNQDMTIVTNFINGRMQSEFRATGLALAADVQSSFIFDGVDFGRISIADIPSRWAQRLFGTNPGNVFRSVSDLQRNTPFMSNLANTRNNSLPTVTIWGNENDPAVWRYFSSINGRAIGAVPEGSIADSDMDMTNLVNNTIRTTRNQADLAFVTGIVKVFAGIFALAAAPITGVTAVAAVGAGIAAFKDFQSIGPMADKIGWLQDSRLIWNSLIGADRTEIVTITNVGGMTEMCRQGINDPNRGWSWYWTTLSQEERTRCWINEVLQVRVNISEESDGVLHKTTQQLGHLAAREQLEAQGVNHEELLNHRRVTERYNEILDGRSHPFFSSSRR